MTVLYTIGFTKKSAEDFFTLLDANQVEQVVDVRLNNTSQLAGFSKQRDLQYFLEKIGSIAYVHLPQLAPTPEILKAYKKGEIKWAEFETEFLELLDSRKVEWNVEASLLDRSCLLCSEEKPDMCHRRLVAEYYDEYLGGLEIIHL